MTAWPKADPRTLVGAISALGLALFLAGGIEARADETIRFKNGHSLTVRSSSVEGETVRVVLANGSEASFPASIVKLTETGVVAAPASAPNVASGFAGRGPRGADLLGSRRADAMAAMAKAGGSSSKRAVAQGFLNSNGGNSPQTVGFSHWGSTAIGLPAPGSQRAPVASIANRPTGRGGSTNGTQGPGGTPASSGIPDGEVVNPSDRTHGHN